VERDRIDATERPEAIRDLLAYRFWVQDRDGRPPRTLGMPVPNPNELVYYEKLNELAHDLAGELKRLRQGPSDQSSTAEETVVTVEAPMPEATGIPTGRPSPQTTRPNSEGAGAARAARVGWVHAYGKQLLGAAGVALAIGSGLAFYRPHSQSVQAPSQLDPQSRQKVERLLDTAEAHRAVGRLSEPPGSNAYEAYRMVLELAPNNQLARRALRAIEAETRMQARKPGR